MEIPFGTALLTLKNVVPSFEESLLPPVSYTMRVMPGECVIIDVEDMPLATAFADLCSGLIRLQTGDVKFMGKSWGELPQIEANALRGLIGRMSIRPSWPDFMPVYFAIVLQQLHHTTVPVEQIVRQASELSDFFGLPGLPTQKPTELSPSDLRRAACVRAFMGQPQLILLEYPLDGNIKGLDTSLMTAITEALNRGASVIWFSRNSRYWAQYHQGITSAWHLGDDGFTSVRME